MERSERSHFTNDYSIAKINLTSSVNISHPDVAFFFSIQLVLVWDKATTMEHPKRIEIITD